MVLIDMKRDTQGKFALKNDNHRLVRSLRLTDETRIALGIAAECLGLTRADYLEQMVSSKLLLRITRKESENLLSAIPEAVENLPCNTPSEEYSPQEDAAVLEQGAVIRDVVDLLTLRERVLWELKLGKQAPRYKAAQKALDHFIAKLNIPA